MRQAIMTRTVFVLFSLLLFGYWGCTSDNPTSSDEPEPQNETVQNVSKSSVEIYQNVAAFEQVSQFVLGASAIVDLEIPELQDPGTAAKFGDQVKSKVLTTVNRMPKNFATIQQDSVIWDITEKDPDTGITHRFALFYDSETGHGRAILVGFDYPASHPLTYDSTEIRADLNFTLTDDSDDVLLSLEHLKRFKPGQLIDEEKGSFVPDAHAPGTEPTGGILTSEITYSSSSFISQTTARFEYHEGQGGSYSKEVLFSDSSMHTEEVTFNEDGTGTYSESRRDGTEIEGTFDSAEEDGVGGYTKTTTFPDGHDPVAISESGDFTFNASDSTISGDFERTVERADGSEEQESVTVDQTRIGDVLTTTLNIQNSDGSVGFITITESPNVDQASGEWINPDETFVKFTAEQYPDGSAHLVFQVWENREAFENGFDPIASGEFDFYPDGSGQGTVTEGGTTYDVTIHPDGSVTITERN